MNHLSIDTGIVEARVTEKRHFLFSNAGSSTAICLSDKGAIRLKL